MRQWNSKPSQWVIGPTLELKRCSRRWRPGGPLRSSSAVTPAGWNNATSRYTVCRANVLMRWSQADVSAPRREVRFSRHPKSGNSLMRPRCSKSHKTDIAVVLLNVGGRADIDVFLTSDLRDLIVDDRAPLLLAVPRLRAARQIADGATCGAGVHLRLWRQTQGSCACRHCSRLAFGDRQQPVEPFQATIDPGPFRLELRDLHLKQSRAADVSTVCDQDWICCPREPAIGE